MTDTRSKGSLDRGEHATACNGGCRGRRRCLRVVWMVVVWVTAGTQYARAERVSDAAGGGDGAAESVAAVLEPFWRGTEICEPLFFVEPEGSGRPTCKLLFKPTEVLSVRSATHDVTFEPGKDYDVNLADGTISVPAGSRIPVTTHEQMYPLMSSDLPKMGRKSGDKKRGIMFAEGPFYHKLQVEVAYRHEPGQWQGPTSKYAGDSLPKTIAKLRDKQPLKIVVFGDSISQGSNASLYTKAPPGCPPYAGLTARSLEKHFGSKVTLTNKAVDGTTSKEGLQLAKDGQVANSEPDLVIIAFGMNDVYFQREAEKYQANIRGMIERIHADAPDAEVILVASMLPNAERGIPLTLFPKYREALAELCGPGVALADVTSIWGELLKHKSFYDLTGNGINHPNDFGHRVYAETILGLLIDAPK